MSSDESDFESFVAWKKEHAQATSAPAAAVEMTQMPISKADFERSSSRVSLKTSRGSTSSSNTPRGSHDFRRASLAIDALLLPEPIRPSPRVVSKTPAELWLRRKLVIILLVPLAGLIVLSVLSLIANANALSDANLVLNNIQLMTPISAFLQQSQRERGITGVFMGSNGTLYQSRLASQRLVLDAEISVLQAALAKAANEGVVSSNDTEEVAIQSSIERLAAHREQVDALAISSNLAVDFYTVLNRALVKLTYTLAAAAKDPRLSERALSFAVFSNAKEKAGLERGIGGQIWAQGTFGSNARYLTWVSLVAGQEVLLNDVFAPFAAEFQRMTVDMITQEGASIIEITDAYRAILLTNNTALIGSQDPMVPIWWFENMTAKIDLQRKAEIAMLDEMSDTAANVRTTAIGQLVATCVILCGTVVATIAVLVWVLKALHGRAQLEAALKRFLPSEFLKLLGTNVTRIGLGDSVNLKLAIVFLDIRDFTTLSENMTDEECFKWLINFTSLLSPIVRLNGGWIDKYMGDGIMAIFENPSSALKCAVMMVDAVKRMNESPEVLNGDAFAFEVGVGVHYGRVILGTVGDDERHDGTIISDAVNLTARLESLTKVYGVHILASADVVDNLSPQVEQSVKMQKLGAAIVKGRAGVVPVYDVYQSDDPVVFAFKAAHQSDFEYANQLFRDGYFKQCRDVCREIMKEYKKLGAQAEYQLEDYGGGRPYLWREREAEAFIHGFKEQPKIYDGGIVDIFINK